MTDDLGAWLRQQVDDEERGVRGLIAWPAVHARAQAERRILDLHSPERVGVFVDLSCPVCWRTTTTSTRREAYPCQTLRLLALPRADRPGYRDEWRPA